MSAVVFCLLSGCMTWSPFNCWHEDVDVNYGRYRYQRYILWMKVVERIHDTELSAAYRALVGEPGSPEWRRVNTFSPGVRRSPHYSYHGAWLAMDMFMRALRSDLLTTEARREALVAFLDLLRYADTDGAAFSYVSALYHLTDRPSGPKSSKINVADLPDPAQFKWRPAKSLP